MLQKFKVLAIVEGISYLLILFVTWPLKHFFEILMPNKIVGMSHGFLFIAYVVFAVFLKVKLNWSFKKLGIILLCSIIPFGTFWADKKYLSN